VCFVTTCQPTHHCNPPSYGGLRSTAYGLRILDSDYQNYTFQIHNVDVWHLIRTNLFCFN